MSADSQSQKAGKHGMQRPCWTICFALLWVALLPATIITHVAVGRLVPGISDLPDNLVKGFDIVFGFSSLTADAQKIAVNAKKALAKCDASYNAHQTDSIPAKVQPSCASKTGQGALTAVRDKNIATENTAIDAAFASSLATIQKVTSDKYLGVPGFKNTATQIQTMDTARQDMKKKMTGGLANCYTIVLQMCAMDSQAVLLQNGIAKVNAEINKLTNSNVIKMFKENKSYVQALHAMPYVLILAMIAFTLFWWRGGVCCCCHKGTCWGCIAIPLFILLWLVAFVMWIIIFAIGFAIKHMSSSYKIKNLNGDPTIHEITTHLETVFPRFWNTVFKDLYDGCATLYPASVIFVLVCVFIVIYACCECCCCPYRKHMEEDEKSAPDASTVGNQA